MENGKINFNLFLTSKCNWGCNYCFRTEFDIRANDDSETNNRILKYVPIISKMTDDILLTGGEIGLVSPDILDFIFNMFKKSTIRIATNGTWFETESYQKYKFNKNIMILYHTVENLFDDIKYEKIEDNINIKYNFVVTGKNYQDVPQLLSRYPNITFYPITDLRKKEILPQTFYKKVYDLIHQFDNVPHQIKQAIKVMGGDDKYWIDECIKIKPYRIRIDFNSNKITSCCVPTVGEPISKKSLEQLSTRKLQFPVDNKICTYCVVRLLNKSRDITLPIK